VNPSPKKYQAIPDRPLKALDELQANECRYPFGLDNKQFCGLQAEKGVYCKEHYARCYKENSSLKDKK
jgi:hypothetical protein